MIRWARGDNVYGSSTLCVGTKATGEVVLPRCQESRRWVQLERRLAKFWLEPVALAGTSGFTGQELRKIEKLVVANRDQFVEAWHEYFGP